MQVGKQGSDLCSSSISQYFVRAYFDAGPWGDYVASLVEIYRRRRDVMLDALAEHFPREARWTHPQGGLFIWATMPDYIDTTDLLARALQEKVAFVPGRAAYLDGRGGSSMRLNFSGVPESAIREGRATDRRGRARTGGDVRNADRSAARATGSGRRRARPRMKSPSSDRSCGCASAPDVPPRGEHCELLVGGEVLGRDLVEEVLELLDDPLRCPRPRARTRSRTR